MAVIHDTIEAFELFQPASLEDRANWEPCTAGYGIQWPSIERAQLKGTQLKASGGRCRP